MVCERTRSKPSYDTARLVEVLRCEQPARRSRAARTSACMQGACGGCSMQHLQPRAQVAIKQRVLEDTLWHVGRGAPRTGVAPDRRTVLGLSAPSASAVRDVAKKGGVLVGFHERASSYVADMRECPVLPPPVE